MPDESRFKASDIVPGGRITTRIWQQDGWGHLVAAAAKEALKVDAIAAVTGRDAVRRKEVFNRRDLP